MTALQIEMLALEIALGGLQTRQQQGSARHAWIGHEIDQQLVAFLVRCFLERQITAGALVEQAQLTLDRTVIRAPVAGVVGAMFLLTWLGDGGLFPFIVGIALLGYALPRLLAALRAQGQRATNKALIDQAFGRSGTQSKGTGK